MSEVPVKQITFRQPKKTDDKPVPVKIVKTVNKNLKQYTIIKKHTI